MKRCEECRYFSDVDLDASTRVNSCAHLKSKCFGYVIMYFKPACKLFAGWAEKTGKKIK